MSRRRYRDSSAEKHVVGEIAYADLLQRAMKLLNDTDQVITGCIAEGLSYQISELLGVSDEQAEEQITETLSRVAEACRTLAATHSLLSDGPNSHCAYLALDAGRYRRLTKRHERASADWSRLHSEITRLLARQGGRAEKSVALNGATRDLYRRRHALEDQLKALSQQLESLQWNAALHVTTCATCPEAVVRVLGRDWSPF